MIFHGNRLSLKPGISDEEIETAMESWRNQGRACPSVRSFIVGRTFGGEYDYGAVFVFDDLDGYEEYMNHPAHLNTDRVGLPLVDKFASWDVSDDPDPELAEKIADIHRRRFENLPDIAELVSGIGEYTGSAAPGKHAT